MSIIGNKAPNFAGTAALHDEQISVKLDDYKGKWLILFFYPLDFTFVCPTEVVAFAEAHEKFKAANAEILGASVDSVHTHLAWIRTPREDAGVGDLPFPLFADLDKSLAASYDVLTGDKSLRGVFIIDPEGTVVSATINSLPLGRNVAEIYRTLKAAQFAAESGDVCPANWQDGDEGMSESLDGVKKHYAATH